jgi:hypothetical protein
VDSEYWISKRNHSIGVFLAEFGEATWSSAGFTGVQTVTLTRVLPIQGRERYTRLLHSAISISKCIDKSLVVHFTLCTTFTVYCTGLSAR